MSKIEALIHLDCLSQLRDGFIKAVRIDVSLSEIGIDDERERIELQGPLYLRNLTPGLTRAEGMIGEPVMSRRVIRV